MSGTSMELLMYPEYFRKPVDETGCLGAIIGGDYKANDHPAVVSKRAT
jgi:hypothetical protein